MSFAVNRSKKSAYEFGRILGQASRMWRRAVDHRVQQFGLTEATWLPLIHLVRADAPLRQKDLALLMSLDGSSIVRLLDNLQAASLVRREEEASDRRAKSIVLTTRGRTLANQIETVVRQVPAEVLSGLSDHEIEVTYKVLQHICARLKLMNEKGD